MSFSPDIKRVIPPPLDAEAAAAAIARALGLSTRGKPGPAADVEWRLGEAVMRAIEANHPAPVMEVYLACIERGAVSPDRVFGALLDKVILVRRGHPLYERLAAFLRERFLANIASDAAARARVLARLRDDLVGPCPARRALAMEVLTLLPPEPAEVERLKRPEEIPEVRLHVAERLLLWADPAHAVPLARYLSGPALKEAEERTHALRLAGELYRLGQQAIHGVYAVFQEREADPEAAGLLLRALIRFGSPALAFAEERFARMESERQTALRIVRQFALSGAERAIGFLLDRLERGPGHELEPVLRAVEQALRNPGLEDTIREEARKALDRMRNRVMPGGVSALVGQALSLLSRRAADVESLVRACLNNTLPSEDATLARRNGAKLAPPLLDALENPALPAHIRRNAVRWLGKLYSPSVRERVQARLRALYPTLTDELLKSEVLVALGELRLPLPEEDRELLYRDFVRSPKLADVVGLVWGKLFPRGTPLDAAASPSQGSQKRPEIHGDPPSFPPPSVPPSTLDSDGATSATVGTQAPVDTLADLLPTNSRREAS